MKEYFLKQIQDIKSAPKCIIKKWYFWLIVIAIIYGLVTDVFAPKEEQVSSINNIEENIVIENNVQEEDSNNEQKEAEKAEKEKQKNIEDTKWTLYATTEQVVKNRLKVPQTAKFSNQQAVYDEENQIYKVQGNVAAENSFGGTVNSTFYAEYNNQLQIIYMTFDGEVIVNER